jgi:hypothetical protein
MRFRDSSMSGALALGGALVVGACATSGAGNEHGPVFSDASAGDSAAAEGGGADALLESSAKDAASETSSDDAPPGDASQETSAEAGGDAALDGSSEAESEAASEAGEAAAPCTSTMALLAAGSSSTAVAVYGQGQWSSATAISGGAAAGPSLVSFCGGYLGAFVGSGTAPLEWTAYTGSWSAPAQIASALGQGIPALAVTGAAAQVVYWGTDDKFYHGIYSSSWNAANDPVGSPQSFGPSGPSATAIGADVLVAQSGQDGTLYDQTWSGTWGAANPHAGTLLEPSISPAVVPLSGTGPDAMIVFVSAADAGSYYLQYTVRTGTTWSAPEYVFDQTGHVAYTSYAPSLAALPGGGAILAWWGSSPAYAYESTYGAGGWTSPIGVSADTIQSPPSVAAGVCGADAVAAYVTTAGTVSVATLTAGTWTTPVPIGDASGMQTVAIATTP